jgi:hypothetical protein
VALRSAEVVDPGMVVMLVETGADIGIDSAERNRPRHATGAGNRVDLRLGEAGGKKCSGHKGKVSNHLRVHKRRIFWC